MPFNILAVRSPGETSDMLYPEVLKKGKSVQLMALDGNNVATFIAADLSVWELRDQQYHRIGHFGGTHYSVFLTDDRVIILSSNFKHADASFLTFDLPGLYVASAVLAKLQTYGRALTGQVRLPNLSRLTAKGTGSHLHPNQVRLYIRERTEGTPRNLFLQITFKRGTDPRPFAQQVVHRAAHLWLRPSRSKDLSSETIEQMKLMTRAGPLRTSDEKWATYPMPFCIDVLPVR